MYIGTITVTFVPRGSLPPYDVIQTESHMLLTGPVGTAKVLETQIHDVTCYYIIIAYIYD
jgi:hypothetical protein